MTSTAKINLSAQLGGTNISITCDIPKQVTGGKLCASPPSDIGMINDVEVETNPPDGDERVTNIGRAYKAAHEEVSQRLQELGMNNVPHNVKMRATEQLFTQWQKDEEERQLTTARIQRALKELVESTGAWAEQRMKQSGESAIVKAARRDLRNSDSEAAKSYKIELDNADSSQAMCRLNLEMNRLALVHREHDLSIVSKAEERANRAEKRLKRHLAEDALSSSSEYDEEPRNGAKRRRRRSRGNQDRRLGDYYRPVYHRHWEPPAIETSTRHLDY